MDEYLQIFFYWIDFFWVFCPLNHDYERNDGMWTHIFVDDTWCWLLLEYNRWIFTVARYTTLSSPPNVGGIFAVDRGLISPFYVFLCLCFAYFLPFFVYKLTVPRLVNDFDVQRFNIEIRRLKNNCLKWWCDRWWWCLGEILRICQGLRHSPENVGFLFVDLFFYYLPGK